MIYFSTDLEIEELDNLKKMFFRNIGFINLRVIERLSSLSQIKVKLFKLKIISITTLMLECLKKLKYFWNMLLKYTKLN